jgi:hypothetical protein
MKKWRKCCIQEEIWAFLVLFWAFREEYYFCNPMIFGARPMKWPKYLYMWLVLQTPTKTSYQL